MLLPYSQQVYRPTLHAPAQARQFVVDRLSMDLDGSTTLDDAMLTVTELVTNAINAGSSHIEVGVELNDDFVSMAVTDDMRASLGCERSRPFLTHGRGLRIVAALATRWGRSVFPAVSECGPSCPLCVSVSNPRSRRPH